MWNGFFSLQSVNGDKHVRLNGNERRRSTAKDEEKESLYSLYSTNSPNSSK